MVRSTRVSPEAQLESHMVGFEGLYAYRRNWLLEHSLRHSCGCARDGDCVVNIHLIAGEEIDTRAPDWRRSVVDDTRGERFRVRHRDSAAVVRSDLRRAKRDPLDAAFCLADDDLIAEFERAQ